MSRCDIVVVGGGVNGLVAAALLARGGRRVVLVESRNHLGGLAAIEPVVPGCRAIGPLHDTTGLRLDLLEPLGLSRHGLRRRARRADLLVLGGADGPRRRPGEPSTNEGGYGRMRAFVDGVAAPLRRFATGPALDLLRIEANPLGELVRRAVELRGLGGERMLELLRVPPLPVADWIDEWLDDPALAAALALPAAAATYGGPRSPGTAVSLLLDEALAGPDVEGGTAAVVEAVEAAARAAGVDVRCGCRVTGIELDGGGVGGARLAGGSRIETRELLLTTHPRALVDELLPPGRLGRRVERDLRALRGRGTVAQLLLALDGPLELDGSRAAAARIASDCDEIERAFDAAKHGRLPERPVLDVAVPTVERPDLAEGGRESVSLLVGFVPPPGSIVWDEATRAALAARAIARLAEHAPGVDRRVIAHRLRTPEDLQEELLLPGGCLRHVEHALDQLLVRPTPALVRHATPIRGLYVGGSASHPGGGLTGAPGALAAAVIAAQRET